MDEQGVMECLDLWRSVKELTVKQAAILIAGEDPSILQYTIENLNPENRPPKYEAAKAALVHDILNGYLRTAESFDRESEYIEIMSQVFDNEMLSEYVPANVNIDEITLYALSIKKWLQNKNLADGFFNDTEEKTSDFMDSSNPCYAPKLAAAVSAWRAVSKDYPFYKDGTVKKAIKRYIENNFKEFGLMNAEGEVSKKALDEISSISNWNLKGGAPKTPNNFR